MRQEIIAEPSEEILISLRHKSSVEFSQIHVVVETVMEVIADGLRRKCWWSMSSTQYSYELGTTSNQEKKIKSNHCTILHCIPKNWPVYVQTKSQKCPKRKQNWGSICIPNNWYIYVQTKFDRGVPKVSQKKAELRFNWNY